MRLCIRIIIWNKLRSLGLLPKKKDDLNGFTSNGLNEHFAQASISHDEDSQPFDDIVNAAQGDGF